MKGRSSEINGFLNVFWNYWVLQRRSLSEVDCSKYEQQRHQKHDRRQWKVWSLAWSAADWTTSGDAVWSLCRRPTEGLLSYTLEPCHTDNETPVRPTSIWCDRHYQWRHSAADSMHYILHPMVSTFTLITLCICLSCHDHS